MSVIEHESYGARKGWESFQETEEGTGVYFLKELRMESGLDDGVYIH